MARLECVELCRGWAFPVLDRLSFTVDAGEFFVVVGPSGIGKTTLLRCIAGLERLDGGKVLLGGRDVTEVRPYRRNVAMTFESYALYPHLSVFENIASPLRARGRPKGEIEQTVGDVARLLRIDTLLQRRPHEISGGQKQRTALARTLVAKPDAFLLDEPISHLDAKIRHELRRQFHTLQELRRTATVYVTHDYAEALSLGDRIAVLGPRGFEQVGRPHDVFERPATLFVARHLGQPSINELRVELVETDGRLEARGEAIRFPVAPDHVERLRAADVRRPVAGIRPQHLRVVERVPADGLARAEARVDVYEALGAHGVLMAEAGGVPLAALTRPEAHFRSGERITLGLDPARVHYFAPDDGRSLLTP